MFLYLSLLATIFLIDLYTINLSNHLRPDLSSSTIENRLTSIIFNETGLCYRPLFIRGSETDCTWREHDDQSRDNRAVKCHSEPLFEFNRVSMIDVRGVTLFFESSLFLFLSLSFSLCLFLFLYNGSNGFFEKLEEKEFARTNKCTITVMRSLIKRKFIGSRGYCKGD